MVSGPANTPSIKGETPGSRAAIAWSKYARLARRFSASSILATAITSATNRTRSIRKARSAP